MSTRYRGRRLGPRGLARPRGRAGSARAGGGEGRIIVMANTPTVQVVAEIRGAVPLDEVGFAVNKVGSLLRLASQPVLSARVKLTAYPSVRGRAAAQVNVNLNGRLLRAEASGPTMRVAVQHAGDRLRIRLVRAARNWEAIRWRTNCPRRRRCRANRLPPVHREVHRSRRRDLPGCGRPSAAACSPADSTADAG